MSINASFVFASNSSPLVTQVGRGQSQVFQAIGRQSGLIKLHIYSTDEARCEAVLDAASQRISTDTQLQWLQFTPHVYALLNNSMPN